MLTNRPDPKEKRSVQSVYRYYEVVFSPRKIYLAYEAYRALLTFVHRRMTQRMKFYIYPTAYESGKYLFPDNLSVYNLLVQLRRAGVNHKIIGSLDGGWYIKNPPESYYFDFPRLFHTFTEKAYSEIHLMLKDCEKARKYQDARLKKIKDMKQAKYESRKKWAIEHGRQE